jgi:hypothetical protein
MPMIDVYAPNDLLRAGSDRRIGEELTSAVSSRRGRELSDAISSCKHCRVHPSNGSERGSNGRHRQCADVRTGIEQRTRSSGEPIEAYEATSGAFRKMMTTVSPDMFPGDPVCAAAAIYEIVASESPRHWVVLGSDAQRRIGAKLDMLRAEFEAGADTARSTDYPGSAKAIL